MSAATNPNLRYSMESVRTIEAIKERIGEILRQRATERALREDRELVTGDDVFQSIRDTLKAILEEPPQQKPEP